MGLLAFFLLSNYDVWNGNYDILNGNLISNYDILNGTIDFLKTLYCICRNYKCIFIKKSITTY